MDICRTDRSSWINQGTLSPGSRKRDVDQLAMKMVFVEAFENKRRFEKILVGKRIKRSKHPNTERFKAGSLVPLLSHCSGIAERNHQLSCSIAPHSVISCRLVTQQIEFKNEDRVKFG